MSKVHIRKKAISKDRHTWYLDFSPPLRNPKNGNVQRFEFLQLFTFDKPIDALQRQHNSETKILIEHIRANRQLDIQNRKFGFLSDRDRNASFVDYYGSYTSSRQRSESDNYAMAFRYFVAFAGYDVNFNDLDEFFCVDFRNFLQSGPGVGTGKTPTEFSIDF